MLKYRALLGPVILVLLVGVAALWSPFAPHGESVDVRYDEPEPTPEDVVGASWEAEDWVAFDEKVRWALDQRLDTLPLGAAMAAMGQSFVGTAYVAGTLEVDGPERVVINFRGLDCVTFVENVYALSQFVRATGNAYGAKADVILANRAGVEDRYETLLGSLRYRDGTPGAYSSRLHYFTDWIADNDRRGRVINVTAGLGGVLDMEPINFMTTHAGAYRQLVDPALVEEVRSAEERLSAYGRYFVPQDRIAAVADQIQDGDIIAATSTVGGLDVAHTGLALWVDGSLRLMHAPLVGSVVQISEVSLAERVQGIGGQDGIMVARPNDTRGGGA